MTIRTASSPYVCGWTFDDEACPKLAAAFEDEATAVKAQTAVDQAGEILYGLSGRQYGACEVTVRPCRQTCMEERGWGTGLGLGWGTGPRWIPVLRGGQWLNISCRQCKASCSCTNVCEVNLPGPVISITEIRLNGSVVDPAGYRVDNRRSLVRLGAGECWPLCQDMNADVDQPDTWQVTYEKGLPLPVAGQVALGALACELAKASLGDKDCALPERVTTIVRQGLTMALLDPMDFLTHGRTGIYSVDIWLATVNPYGRARHAGVYSPDVPLVRSTTWP